MSREGGQEIPSSGSSHRDDKPSVPGEFSRIPEGLRSSAERIEDVPESHADLVAKYKLFRDKLSPRTNVVYHPCGANDISPSAAFPDSRVVYTDIDDGKMQALRAKGFEAHTSSALDFDPGNVDVLIMLNPTIRPDVPSSHVVLGGYVLCNDYHDTASHLKKNDGYELEAMIRVGKEQKLVWDTEKLNDYWREVETDEEFRNAPFNWGSVNYSSAAKVVEAITGKKENILVEYKKIIEQARENKKRENAERIRNFKPATKEDLAMFGGDTDDPEPTPEAQLEEFTAVLGNPDLEDVFNYHHGGEQYLIYAKLPGKKGTVDDLFVFKKIRENKDERSLDKKPA